MNIERKAIVLLNGGKEITKFFAYKSSLPDAVKCLLDEKYSFSTKRISRVGSDVYFLLQGKFDDKSFL